MNRSGSVVGIILVLALVAGRFFWKDLVGLFASPAPAAFPTRSLRPLTQKPSDGEAAPKQHVLGAKVQLTPLERSRLKPLGVVLSPGPAGRLAFSYRESDDPNDYTAVTFLLNAALFRTLSDQVFRFLPLQEDLPVVVTRCGIANAYWSRDTRSIVLCTELVDHFHAVFRSAPPAEQRAGVEGALLFTLTHELGHAAEDVLQLKLTGRAEDNADQFATLLLLAMGEQGLRAVLAAASWFRAEGGAELRAGRIAFWDEHALNAQRYINLLCYLYGQDPFRHVFLVGDQLLPATRATRCGDEYQRMRAGWKEELDRRLKTPLP